MGLFKHGADPWSPTPAAIGAGLATAGELAGLQRRVNELEWRLKRLEQLRPMATMAGDQSRWYHAADFQDMPPALGITSQALPWVSRLTQFREQLTSFEFVKVTFGESLLIGICGAIAGGGVAWWLELDWITSPIVGIAAFALCCSALVLHNRALLNYTVRATADKVKQRSELVLNIHKEGEGGAVASGKATADPIDRLIVACDLKAAQLQEWAKSVLDGRSLGVNSWTGKGAVFSRPQYDAFMAELELLGYAVDRGGNTGRVLTSKGKALARALAER